MRALRVLAIVICTTVVALLAAGCASVRVPDDAQVLQRFGTGAGARLPDSVSVLVWNVYKGQRSGWREDLVRLGEDADLLLLQEAITSGEMVRTLRSIEGVQWDFAASFEYVEDEHATGVMTGSRTPPASVRYVRSDDREPIVGTPKMALLTLHALTNRETSLLVVNVHGHLAVTTETFTEQMMRIAERVAGHHGPVLWAGDFNTWTDARNEAIRELASRLRLTEVTFATDGRTSVLGNVLDRAFVRDLHIASARALPEIESSDHVPFVLELEVRSAL